MSRQEKLKSSIHAFIHLQQERIPKNLTGSSRRKLRKANNFLTWSQLLTAHSYWKFSQHQLTKPFFRGSSRKRRRMLFKVSHETENRRMLSCVLVWCFLMCLCLFLKAARGNPCQIRQLGIPEIYKYLLSQRGNKLYLNNVKTLLVS